MFQHTEVRRWAHSEDLATAGVSPAPANPITVDIHESEDAFLVTASVPGVLPEDIGVSVCCDLLTITAARHADEEVRRQDYVRREHRYGVFSRSMLLSAEVDAGEATGTFKHGVIRLTLPKLQPRGGGEDPLASWRMEWPDPTLFRRLQALGVIPAITVTVSVAL